MASALTIDASHCNISSKLTTDTLKVIFAFLDPFALYSSSKVSKSFFTIIGGNEILWKSLLQRMSQVVQETVLFAIFRCDNACSRIFA